MSDEKDNKGKSSQCQGPVGRLFYIIEKKENYEAQQGKGRDEAKNIVYD